MTRSIPAARCRPRAAALAAPALAVLLTVTACGSGGDGSGGDGSGGDGGGREVASLGSADVPPDGSAGPDGTTGDSAPTDPEAAMLAFTRCMRDHGIDMADPQRSADGAGVVVVAQPSGIDDSIGGPIAGPDEDFQEAQEACQPIMDAVIGDIEIDPEQLAEQREQMLDFAACMRDHGIDMPDPVFGDNGSVSIEMHGDEAGAGPDDEAWQVANEACSELLGLPTGPVLNGSTDGGAGIVVGGGPDGGEG